MRKLEWMGEILQCGGPRDHDLPHRCGPRRQRPWQRRFERANPRAQIFRLYPIVLGIHGDVQLGLGETVRYSLYVFSWQDGVVSQGSRGST